MQLADIFSLFGGLALFLYGMHIMSTGLEAAAGDRLKSILEMLTSKRILGVLVGAGITAIIQSSSATTVMVVGFVNSGLMTLQQAVGVIMGANVGTTMTSLLIALDVSLIAPLLAFVGVVMITMVKRQNVNCVGQIVAGLGILFLGMEMMSSSMMPLRDYQPFIDLLTSFSNPLLGILAGLVFTAVIQSSSASIGILQALALSGVIGLDNAVYVLFGQNIGTCVTAVLASLNGNRAAKRTTLIHLMFNVMGAALFTVICMATPFVSAVQSWIPSNVPGQIAATHMIFNVVTTVVLFPFGDWMAKAACRILPDQEAGESERYVIDHGIGSTAIALSTVQKRESAMFALARENVALAFDALLERDESKLEKVTEQEDQIDLYNAEITRIIGHTSSHEMPEADSERFDRMLIVCGNIERIGDHAMNMAEYLAPLKKRHIHMDADTMQELYNLRTLVTHAFLAIDFEDEDGKKRKRALDTVAILEADSDEKNRQYRAAQIRRMREGHVDPELSILYSEILTDIERMLDHMLNIVEALCPEA
ncbi:Na/Pi cotransporter family protein [Pseudoflavonifractor sp. MSJ-37]|uniref:Na/Pi cotransporter family protein n=1 Tax=Pseudoflavonifractor sp. MSJ-37 TaxID=2841531 RepID=UPI001C11C4A3|nr:Na/Pi cotransporter family protein [Pseudoflavonifractor sp. MSJ-37]MBU5435008.1 Na/Pi cotransporter family protein [Pseudoflavonifractor sp. MSJ-37]